MAEGGQKKAPMGLSGSGSSIKALTQKESTQEGPRHRRNLHNPQPLKKHKNKKKTNQKDKAPTKMAEGDQEKAPRGLFLPHFGGRFGLFVFLVSAFCF